MVFLWFSNGNPYGFPMVFLWLLGCFSLPLLRLFFGAVPWVQRRIFAAEFVYGEWVGACGPHLQMQKMFNNIWYTYVCLYVYTYIYIHIYIIYIISICKYLYINMFIFVGHVLHLEVRFSNNQPHGIGAYCDRSFRWSQTLCNLVARVATYEEYGYGCWMMLGFEDVPNCDPYPYHPYHPYPKNVQEILGFKHTHRIHGAGIYASIKVVYWWDPCYHI